MYPKAIVIWPPLILLLIIVAVSTSSNQKDNSKKIGVKKPSTTRAAELEDPITEKFSSEALAIKKIDHLNPTEQKTETSNEDTSTNIDLIELNPITNPPIKWTSDLATGPGMENPNKGNTNTPGIREIDISTIIEVKIPSTTQAADLEDIITWNSHSEDPAINKIDHLNPTDHKTETSNADVPTTSAAELEAGNHGDFPPEDSIIKDIVPWMPAEHDTDTPYDTDVPTLNTVTKASTTSAADLEAGNHRDVPLDDSAIKNIVPWNPAEHDTDTPYDTDQNRDELADLTSEIKFKQTLIEDFEQIQRRLVTRNVHYKDKLNLLMKKINITQDEKDKVFSIMMQGKHNDNDLATTFKAEYAKKINTMQQELKKLQVAQEEHVRLMRKHNKRNGQLRTMKSDLIELKKTKFKLMNKIKDDNNQEKNEKLQKNKKHEAENRLKNQALKRKEEDLEYLEKDLTSELSYKATGRSQNIKWIRSEDYQA